VNTYQRVPKLCDESIEARGGHRLLSRGEGDASGAEFFQAFDTFEANLWDALTKVGDVRFARVRSQMTDWPESGIRDAEIRDRRAADEADGRGWHTCARICASAGGRLARQGYEEPASYCTGCAGQAAHRV
jgi:hypothetical protein